jgi:hypothetical protein
MNLERWKLEVFKDQQYYRRTGWLATWARGCDVMKQKATRKNEYSWIVRLTHHFVRNETIKREIKKQTQLKTLGSSPRWRAPDQ